MRKTTESYGGMRNSFDDYTTSDQKSVTLTNFFNPINNRTYLQERVESLEKERKLLDFREYAVINSRI